MHVSMLIVVGFLSPHFHVDLVYRGVLRVALLRLWSVRKAGLLANGAC